MTITGLPQAEHEKTQPAGNLRHGAHRRRGAGSSTSRTASCRAGESGEIVTRSDCVMAGYWQNPEATARALRGGWLHTGDVGSLDAEGFLTLKDRSKDLIISGGSNIYPREIEEVLLRHPAVAECSVVGRPHAEWGEEVVAFIVASAKVDESASWTRCASTTSRASSGQGTIASSRRCRRTTTARC